MNITISVHDDPNLNSTLADLFNQLSPEKKEENATLTSAVMRRSSCK